MCGLRGAVVSVVAFKAKGRGFKSTHGCSHTVPKPSFNPIQARGALCAPHLNDSISSKRLGVWIYCFVTFLSMYFPLRKVQFHQSALMYVAMATMQLFGLFLKTRIAIVFQVFPPERNFLWDNLLCFGHHNTLRSLIIANIKIVTMDTVQKTILPKYGHQH